MRTSAHVCASAAAAGAVYGFGGQPAAALACLLSGIFLDADHLLDYYLLADEPFTIKAFRSWCYEMKWKKIYLVLHSYELFALAALAAWAFPGAALAGALLGMGLHLLMDQAGNKALNRWFYFMTFRYRCGFAVGALAPGRGR